MLLRHLALSRRKSCHIGARNRWFVRDHAAGMLHPDGSPRPLGSRPQGDSAELRAGVAWYGSLGGKTSDAMPKHPLDLAKEVKAPVLGLYGAKDSGIPLADVDRMRDALKDSGSKSEFVVYAEAGHGFNADFRPGDYRKQDAEDGWKRMLAWFKLWGVA